MTEFGVPVGKIILDPVGRGANGLSYLSNAAINKMKKEEIVEALRSVKLNPRGNKDEVSKRLKSYWKRQREMAKTQGRIVVRDRFYDFLVVVDFECTCEALDNFYPHEIIEFPAVLIRSTTGEVVDEFHSYCKPSLNPTLTQFCKGLTGITQEQVDNAPPFLDVLERFLEFLRKHELGSKYRFAFVTDGPYDFGNFLQIQCQHLSIPIPHHMRNWINVRRSFCRAFEKERTSLEKMLDEFGMEFDGQRHSGIDDSRNIARVTSELLAWNANEVRVNERLLRRDKLEEAGKDASPMRDVLNSDEEEDDTEGASSSHGEKQDNHRTDQGRRPAPKKRPFRIFPYKVLTVSKDEFMRDAYEACFTCGEEEDEDEEEEEKAEEKVDEDELEEDENESDRKSAVSGKFW